MYKMYAYISVQYYSLKLCKLQADIQLGRPIGHTNSQDWYWSY